MICCAEALCCAGTLCCKTLCCCCSKSCGSSRKTFYRLGYLFFSLIWIGIALILMYFGGKMFKWFGLSCPGKSGDQENVCLGVGAVMRISFTLAIFHLILGLICLCPSKITNTINEGAWPIKFLIVLGLFAVSFFIPEVFFKYYGYIAKGSSLIFIVFQILMLVDIAYAWNDKWLGIYDSTEEGSGTERCWGIILIIFTLIFFGGAIGMSVFLYLEYDSRTGDIILISMCIAAAVAYTGLSASPLVEHGSIFTCSIIFLFTIFLTWSALLSEPCEADGECESSNADTLTQVFIGLGFMLLALFYLSASTTSSDQPQREDNPIQQVSAPLKEQEDSHELLEGGEEEQEAPQVTLQTFYFHLIMVFTSLYYAMLLTNWGNPYIGDETPEYFSGSNWMSYGIKVAGAWLGIALFLWSLIAPKICGDREFS